MKPRNDNADILIPDGMDIENALKRTTHLGIGAHQDDLEIVMTHGILECFGRTDRWFTGITCTDGAGSARAGLYADYTDDDMKRVRLQEQRTAARIGSYSAAVQLGYSSKDIKAPRDNPLDEDLFDILKAARPKIVYTQNPADKHDTHVAVVLSALRALRRLPPEERPEKVYGCEAWRDLDWLPDNRKIVLDLSEHENLQAALMGIFDSQIAGGKRYDLAAMGRHRSNATFLESHAVDKAAAAMYAMDLTPLVRDENLDPVQYVLGFMDDLKNDVRDRMAKFL